MAKRPLPASAFALPGLSKPDSKKPYGLSSSRGDNFSSSSKNLSSKNGRASTADNLNDSSSLVDNKGSLLPPKTEHTLDNLTKTRPRSPGRRSLSPLARRKFEHDSTASDPVDLFNSSLEAGNSETSTKDHKDSRADHFKALKERTTFSPALILTNDVGLSVSSNELSVSRTSPKVRDKNRTNRPEVLPKPSRNRNTAQDVSEKSDLVAGVISDKNVDKRVRDHDPKIDGPPPLPSSPPPLDDNVSHSDNHSSNKEKVQSLQRPLFEKARKTADNTDFDYDLSTKLGKPIKDPNEINGFNETKQLKGMPPSDITNDSSHNEYLKDSSSSKIAKWQGYGRNWSDGNHTYGMPKVGAGIPERQTPLDSAITARLSKYESPYSSRQCKPVDKSPSSRRRRFKPVTLTDKSENANSETAVEEIQSIDSSLDLATSEANQSVPGSERLYGTQTENNYFDTLPRDDDERIIKKTEDFSPRGSRIIDSSFQRKDFAPGEKVKQVSGFSPSPSVSGSAGDAGKSRYLANMSDKFGTSRLMNQEPMVMLEYDSRSNTEKIVEIETNETVPFVVSDLRNSNRSKTQSNNTITEIKKSKNDSNNDRNEQAANRIGSSGLTLPKVVIEYDGEVFSDPMVHGCDTETSDEDKKSSSSFGGEEDQIASHQTNYKSDNNLHVEDDDVAYGDYTDEEEDLDLGLDDESLDGEDLTFEDLDSAREEMEKAKG